MSVITNAVGMLLGERSLVKEKSPSKKIPMIIRVYEGGVLKVAKRVKVECRVVNRVELLVGTKPVTISHSNFDGSWQVINQISLAFDMEVLKDFEVFVPLAFPAIPAPGIHENLTLQPDKGCLVILSNMTWVTS